MRPDDGRTLSAPALEERRRTIVRMRQAGKPVEDIQQATGAGYQTVYSVWNAWNEYGEESIPVHKRGNKPGERRHLSAEQEALLQETIRSEAPDTAGLDFALWTREAVRQLIGKQCGFEMPVRTVGSYLARWGFTPQKPAKRAYEQKNEAVREWLTVTYPAIRDRAKAEGAEIYWGDESSLRASDVRGRGYAPAGTTPVVEATARRENLSMAAAITNQGKVSWLVVEGAVNTERFLEFLVRLLCDAPRKVFLILDNLNVHRAGVVTDWVEEQKGAIELFFLPPYSPDLNPDERLNADVKYGVGSKAPVRTKSSLRKAAEDHLQMLARSPERIRKYFLDPQIRYAAV